MTNEQAKKMLKAKLECLKRETSGTDFASGNDASASLGVRPVFIMKKGDRNGD